jgi:hypothetical protein
MTLGASHRTRVREKALSVHVRATACPSTGWSLLPRLTVSGLIGIWLHAPIGALIDATEAKRVLLVGGVVALAAAAAADALESP